MQKLTFSIFSLSFLLVFVINLYVARAEESSGLTEESVAKRINKFGCNLLHGLYENAAAEENILVSPVNTYTGLALLHLAAGAKTRNELATVMKITDSKNATEIHHVLKSVIAKLFWQPDEPKYHETILANGIFLQDSFPVKASYLEAAKKYYDSSAKNVDFSGKPQEATDVINEFISTSTKGRIAKFYDEPLKSDTVAVLTSALYFNAKWKEPFMSEQTKNEKFNTGLKEIQTPMMSMSTSLYYVSDNNLHYDSVTLPYSGYEYEMTIYLQHQGHGDHGSLADLFHELAQKNFITSGSLKLIDLKVPKMKFSWKKSVVEALKLKEIFNAADLEELTSMKNLKVSNMIHATELEVDENGTVATAASAIEVSLLSAFEPANKEPIKFHVDRPFLLTIGHKTSKTILFAGVVRKPAL